ncbi:hypothetical protein [Veronia pacifica]|uniref:Uncharacterized protein n=1 Tax=Veronia pacifica TaxID=1080227 RepID=A0A1C3E966_9GAMM|nr:hypothetical protein [Veronia pacifica]ODA29817.1 hypothetical protein A8L45_21710 [Veronia pacifica]
MLNQISAYIPAGQVSGQLPMLQPTVFQQPAVMPTVMPQSMGGGGTYNAARFNAAQHFAQTQGLRFGIPCTHFPVFNHCGPFFPSKCGFVCPPCLPRCCPMPQYPGFGYGHGYNHGYEHGHHSGFNSGYLRGIEDAMRYRFQPIHIY